MPFRHDIRTVTVPGCVDGWLALHGRSGRLSLGEVLQPAILSAAEGFPVSPLLAADVALLDAVAGTGDLLAFGPLRRGQLVRQEQAAAHHAPPASTGTGSSGLVRAWRTRTMRVPGRPSSSETVPSREA